MRTSPEQVLQPTLWRTCRVLANPARLALLAAVARQPGACVRDLARTCRVEPNTASEYLRALQARGLLRVRRVIRWTHYEPGADPAVRHAAAILGALLAAIRRGDQPAEMIRAATAFTHTRRIALARTLTDVPIEAGVLARRCGIPQPALHRHLVKLQRRQMAERVPGGLWRRVTPAKPFARRLLAIALLD